MSNSKFIMAKKLAVVQEELMSKTIDDVSLDGLLPLIFKICREENLMFWFNFLEDAVVLNLRDVSHENHELNIRYAYETVPKTADSLEYYKTHVLINAFLITKESVLSEDNNVASSDALPRGVETPILSGDRPVPKPIRNAIDRIQGKGIPVTAETIHNHLPLGEMSVSSRLECNKYLKEMEASQ